MLKTNDTFMKYSSCKLPVNRCRHILLTAYRNSPMPYTMVSSPTSYDVLYSHNTYVADGQMKGAYE